MSGPHAEDHSPYLERAAELGLDVDDRRTGGPREIGRAEAGQALGEGDVIRFPNDAVIAAAKTLGYLRDPGEATARVLDALRPFVAALVSQARADGAAEEREWLLRLLKTFTMPVVTAGQDDPHGRGVRDVLELIRSAVNRRHPS